MEHHARLHWRQWIDILNVTPRQHKRFELRGIEPGKREIGWRCAARGPQTCGDNRSQFRLEALGERLHGRRVMKRRCS